MARWWLQAILLVVCLSAVAGCVSVAFAQKAPVVPSQPPAQQPIPIPLPAPAVDPRTDPVRHPQLGQIRQLLERQGLKVIEVAYCPDCKPPRWVAGVVATYAQPSYDRVNQVAFVIWNALYTVLGGNQPPNFAYTAVQQWNKYLLVLHAPVIHLVALVNALQAAKTPQEQQKAYQTFFGTLSFAVVDIEREQFVDQKDFINKNFAR